MDLNVVRRISIEAQVKGADQASASLKRLADAHGGVAIASDKQEKSTISVERALDRQRRSLDESYRSQQQFAKAQTDLDRALKQGLLTHTEHGRLSQLNNARLGDLTAGTRVYGATLQAANDNLRGFAQSAGSVGQVLSVLGPAGMVAAAAMGLLTVGFKQAADAALALADRAGKLKDFAETTGFTVVQLQALEKAGAQVGVSSESVTRGLERFSVAMDDVKKGVGPVFESILEINPALAQQMKQVGSLTEAWDIFSKAIKQSDLEQSNKLARSVFGRSGVEITRLARSNADAGGIGGLTNQLKEVDRITAAQAERWDELGDKIAENMKAAKQNVAAIFTEPVLNALLTFSGGFLELSRVARSFTMSDELKLMFKLISAAASTAGAVGSGIGAVTGWLGRSSGATGPSAPAGASFADRWGDSSTGPAVGIDTARLENQKRSLSALIAEQERWAAAMGASVTPAQQLKLSLDKIRLAQLENKISAEQAAQATGVLKAQFESSQFSAYVGALGQAVTVEEQVKAKRLQLNDAIRQGAALTQEQIAFQLQYTRESALGITQIKAAADQERVRAATLLMGKEAALAYEIVQTKINEARLRGAPLTETEIADLSRQAAAYAAVKVEADRYAEAVQSAKDSAQQFATTLVQGLMSGKSLMDSLSASAKQLATSLADSAIKDLFSGNFVSAGIKGVAAIGAALLGSATEQDKSLEEAKNRWKEMTEQVDAFNRAAAGVDLGPLTSGLMQLRSTYQQLAMAALEARDYSAISNLQETFNRGVVRTVLQFETASAVSSDLANQMKAVADEGAGLLEFLKQYGLANQGYIDSISASIARQQQELRDTFERGLVADIRNNSGVGYLNTIADAIRKVSEASAAGVNPNVLQAWLISTAQTAVNSAKLTGDAFNDMIAQFPQLTGLVHQFVDAAAEASQKLSLQLRLLTATTDSSTLGGALTLFDAKATQERNAALAAGISMENLALLDQAVAAERLNVVKDFSQRAIDEEKRLADARIGQMQRIQDYLNNLTGGSNSTLSPQGRLDAARSQFATQLGLAQGGDQNALSSITQYSDNFLQASRAYNASSVAFQNDFAYVQSALAGLISLVGGTSTSAITGGTASVGGVSAISSVANVSAANGNSWAGVIDAVNSLKAEVVILKAALKEAVDNNTKAIAIAHTEENDNLEEIVDELKAIHSSNGNLALAGPT